MLIKGEHYLDKKQSFYEYSTTCHFTDDTVMIIAITNALLEANENYENLKELAIKNMKIFGHKYPHLVDRRHNNWRKRKSRPTELYWQTTKYHLFWLRQIVDMNENKLSTNKIELIGKQS